MSNNPFWQNAGKSSLPAQLSNNGVTTESPNGIITPAVGIDGPYSTELGSATNSSPYGIIDSQQSNTSTQFIKALSSITANVRESNAICNETPRPSLESQKRSPEIFQNGRHAHIPSFSHVGRESFPVSTPACVCPLSSHISDAVAPMLNVEQARAEVLRRLAKAERGPKPLKRRGSNESLSSLLSYSIRRPSISTKANSGHSLETLAIVLEDTAQEGILPLVEAVMALGAHPIYRSIHKLKNRRHDALNKATAAGHVDVIDYLLRQGASYGSDEPLKKDPFTPMEHKLLDMAYAGFGDVVQYFITEHGVDPFIQQWPRQYYDANRTVYRRVVPAKAHQRTVLDAIAKMGNEEQDVHLLNVIMQHTTFVPTNIVSRVYEDIPYMGDGTRMHQTTYHYSCLSAFIKAGWCNAVEVMLKMKPNPLAYQQEDTITKEEGQIPSTITQTFVQPANALSKDTWLYHATSALRILNLLIDSNFIFTIPQKTPYDSAPRTPLSRAILANASQAVDLILQAHPELVKQDITFRLLLHSGEEGEYTAQPLAAAIIQGSLDCARVILRHGAHPSDPAFNYANVLNFAAGHGGVTATAILNDMMVIAPELVPGALETAISKFKVDAVDAILRSSVSEKEVLAMPLYDMLLRCEATEKTEDIKERYLRITEMIHEKDTESAIVRPEEEAIRAAIERGNIIGVEKLVELGVVAKAVF